MDTQTYEEIASMLNSIQEQVRFLERRSRSIDLDDQDQFWCIARDIYYAGNAAQIGKEDRLFIQRLYSKLSGAKSNSTIEIDKTVDILPLEIE